MARLHERPTAAPNAASSRRRALRCSTWSDGEHCIGARGAAMQRSSRPPELQCSGRDTAGGAMQCSLMPLEVRCSARDAAGAAMQRPCRRRSSIIAAAVLHCSSDEAPLQPRQSSIITAAELQSPRTRSIASRRCSNAIPLQHPPLPAMLHCNADVGTEVVHRCSIAAPDATDDVSLQPAPAWRTPPQHPDGAVNGVALQRPAACWAPSQRDGDAVAATKHTTVTDGCCYTAQ